MKKKYNTPVAEKMEFDYTESVEACSPGEETVSDASRDLGNPYYKCSCTPYWVP